MINLEFIYPDGKSVMVYDAHPSSQLAAVSIPDGAVSVIVWFGTTVGLRSA